MLDPAALRAKGVQEVGRYGIEVRAAEIGAAGVIEGGVEVDGITARTLILATGMLDATPDVEGFDAIYGISAHTCPYCDGWEHADQRLAVLCGSDAAAHMAPLLRQWSRDVIVFSPQVEGDIGAPVVREPIARFVSADGQLTAVELAGGERIERDALFFHLAMQPRSELAMTLGCALTDAGFVAASTEDRQTSVDRVYAVGNCTDPMQNVPLAIADGVRAAVAVNVRLIGEVQPVAS